MAEYKVFGPRADGRFEVWSTEDGVAQMLAATDTEQAAYEVVDVAQDEGLFRRTSRDRRYPRYAG